MRQFEGWRQRVLGRSETPVKTLDEQGGQTHAAEHKAQHLDARQPGELLAQKFKLGMDCVEVGAGLVGLAQRTCGAC